MAISGTIGSIVAQIAARQDKEGACPPSLLHRHSPLSKDEVELLALPYFKQLSVGVLTSFLQEGSYRSAVLVDECGKCRLKSDQRKAPWGGYAVFVTYSGTYFITWNQQLSKQLFVETLARAIRIVQGLEGPDE